MKTIKVLFQISLTSLILFLVLRFLTFNVVATDDGTVAPIVNQASYLQNPNYYVRQRIAVEGISKQSYYLLGIGVYRLIDSKGNAVTIISNDYPPDATKVIGVTVYVQPLFKLNDTPTTILLQVKVPETILSLSPKK